MTPLLPFVAGELAAPVPTAIRVMAEVLGRQPGALAVLFYGSALRTGELDGVLDYYVLTDGSGGSPLRRVGMRWLWPDVSFHEMIVGGVTLRAKVATMPLATFEQATRGDFVDTTIWARFVQPTALLWRADAGVATRVYRAVADAAITAARFAAVLGPSTGAPRDYWLALFRQTYRTEMRVEPQGREQQILRFDPARWDRLLPLAWSAAGIAFDEETGGQLHPAPDFAINRTVTEAWMRCVRAGKTLNLARLVKAAFTFEGAARYGLWKVKRHTGVDVALTPWRERHPVLAAPGVLWRVMRATNS